MKKRLLIGLMTFVYLVFCCAGLGFAFADNAQETVHFVHVDGHSDEYHSAIPGKLAIKAFFSKTPVKTILFSEFINPGINIQLAAHSRLFFSETHHNNPSPVKESRYLHNCTFLI